LLAVYISLTDPGSSVSFVVTALELGKVTVHDSQFDVLAEHEFSEEDVEEGPVMLDMGKNRRSLSLHARASKGAI